MNRQGVAVQALSLTAPMVYWADGATRRAPLAPPGTTRASAAHVAHPDRFVGCATLPHAGSGRAPSPSSSARRKLPGIRGVYMGTNVGGRELSDPAFFPVFERAAALGCPVLLHPLNVIGAERLAPYYLNNFLGNPFDTAIAAAHLVFGGVLDRLPKLRGVPAARGRRAALSARTPRVTGRGCGRRRTGVAKKPFSAYLRRFTYDIISHDAPRRSAISSPRWARIG